MYEVLEPIKIGNRTLRNRVMYLAMAKYLSTEDNFVTDRQIAYYTNYAKKGVGLITTGACIVDRDYPSRLPMQPGLYDDKFIPGLKKLAESVQKEGAVFLLQPWHPGVVPYGCGEDEVKSVADFTLEEIHEIQKKFVDAIIRAEQAGVDGCEFHIAHNYLPQQFLTPYFNKRKDQYGADTVENGIRFSVEILEEARKKVKEDFLFTIKINASDMGVEGGIDIERCVEACKLLEKAGAAMISVSAGGQMTDITGMSDDGYRPEGWKVDYAAAVKKAVSVPVMATGSIRHLREAEQYISDGKCDMIGMGRGLLAEPEWVKKVEENRVEEMKHCISCMNCFDYVVPGKSGCSINPLAMREEEEKPLEKNGAGRTVAIIGAGPGGMEAAITLAKRGFKPVVYEKSGGIGGNLRPGSNPVGKRKFKWQIEYLEKEAQRLNIPIHLNTLATIQNLELLDPYAVIAAYGAEPLDIKFKGETPERTIGYSEILNNLPAINDKNIVIVGAGSTGIETALTYVERNNSVTVIDMMDQPTEFLTPHLISIGHAVAKGIPILWGRKLSEVNEKNVVVYNKESGQNETIKADVVVECLGQKINTDFLEEIKSKFDKVYSIGDLNEIRKITDAVKEGYDIGVSLS